MWLRRLLDRETAASHKVRVWAVDGGTPARTATATLLLPVQDVNDNPPHVAGPSALHVPENSWPRHVANVTLGDADDWTLGHGPPFSVVLDTSTPDSIREDFAVDFDSSKWTYTYQIHSSLDVGSTCIAVVPSRLWVVSSRVQTTRLCHTTWKTQRPYWSPDTNNGKSRI